MTTNLISNPVSGIGIGLRSQHIGSVLNNRPDVSWFEVLIDNHLAKGGIIPGQLDEICADYPVTFHSIGMNIGGIDLLDDEYFKKIKQAIRRYQPKWISDHLCFSSVHGRNLHDLLPLPYNEECLKHVCRRIHQIEDILECPLVIENVSSYLSYNNATMTEAEFISNLVTEADCKLLLDVNNIYVNEYNLAESAISFIEAMPTDRIQEIHVAGFEQCGDYLLDAHNNPISQEVWNLYDVCCQYHGHVPTLIEWDNDVPEFEVLMQEADKARMIQQGCFMQKLGACRT